MFPPLSCAQVGPGRATKPVSFARGGLCVFCFVIVSVQRGLSLLDCGSRAGRSGEVAARVLYKPNLSRAMLCLVLCHTHAHHTPHTNEHWTAGRAAILEAGRAGVEGARNNSRLASWGHPSMTVAVAAVSLLGLRRSAPLGAKGRAGKGTRAVAASCLSGLSALWTKVTDA